MRRQLPTSIAMLLVFTVLTGLAYPLVVTGVAQAAFPHQADGSIVRVGGKAVGSRWIGQPFTKPQYFHPRPSAAGDGYDGAASSGSNLGPTNPEYLATIRERVAAYRDENGLGATVKVPVDAVTASGSGLDPEISVANARLQARRVADARDIAVDDVLAMIRQHTSGRGLGFLGEPGVDVLGLNMALDARR